MRLVMSAVLAFSLVAALPAAAFTLTGHWEGSWSCTVFEDGVKTTDGNKNSTLEVTSLGDAFAARFDGNYDVRGVEIDDLTKPEKGEISFAHCGTNDDLTGPNGSELGRLKVSTSGERGTLSGISIWSARPYHIATCKYKFTRVDTVNPNLIYACP
jgi:hypothetical protein